MNKRCIVAIVAIVAAGAAVITGGICTAVCVARRKRKRT